ncbi:hypothetical protein ACHAXM_003089 [Skeletonema potamos]
MAGERVEYRGDKSLGKSQSRPRDSSFSKGSGQMQPSALRSGKYDTSNSKLNELKFDLSEIHAIYGYDATLYHVLSVNRSATASEIKAAYLNKGREILLSGRNPSQQGSDISDWSRKQFQAISLAYEILCKEDLRALYDGRCSVARRNSVQWSKVVQEKIIKDAHPNEHSHRRNSKRAPPPPMYADDSCSNLDDEFDELMYYCNNKGDINFIKFAELQGLVDTLNISMKMEEMHLLESFDTTCVEADRQPSEEVATSEGKDRRQPPAEAQDTRVIRAHNEDTIDCVCDAAEDTIFPVKSDLSQTVDEVELESSTVAIASAAAATAVALVEVETDDEEEMEATDVSCFGWFACGELDLFTYNDGDDMRRCSEIKKEPSAEDAANRTRNSEPEKKSVNIKARPALNLRKAIANRMKSKPALDAEDMKPSTEVATTAAVTSTGWFDCCGATEALANDDDCELNMSTVGNGKDNEENKTLMRTTSAVLVEEKGGSVGDSGGEADRNTPNSKTNPSRKFNRPISSLIKSNNVKKKPSEEILTTQQDNLEEEDDFARSSFFRCCGAPEDIPNEAEETGAAKADVKPPSRMTSSAKRLRNQLTIRKMLTKPLLDTTENETKNEALDGIESEFTIANEDKPRMKMPLKQKRFKRS